MLKICVAFPAYHNELFRLKCEMKSSYRTMECGSYNTVYLQIVKNAIREIVECVPMHELSVGAEDQPVVDTR